MDQLLRLQPAKENHYLSKWGKSLFRIFDRTLYGPRKQRKGESKRRRRRNL